MTRSKKSLIFSATLLVIMILITSVVLFAYFSADIFIGGEFSTSDDFSIKVEQSENADFVFDTQNKKYQNTITVTNTSSQTTINYVLKLSDNNTLQVDTAIRDALILTIDGKKYGMLSKVMNAEGVIDIKEDMPLLPQKSREHIVELELHSGAGARYFGKSYCFEVNAIAQTYVNDKIILVSSLKEMQDKINEFNSGYNEGKTIALSADISWNVGDLILQKPINIDLNGFNLNMNNSAIVANYEEEGVSIIKNSLQNGEILNLKSLDINTPNSFVDYKFDVELSNVNIQSVGEAQIQQQVLKNIQLLTKNGVGAEPIDLVGNLSIYGVENFVFTSLDPAILEITNGKITNKGVNVSADLIANFTFMFGNTLAPKQVSVVICNSAAQLDAYVNEILLLNASYLGTPVAENDISEPTVSLRRDLFLPKVVDDGNATIEWISSNEKLMTSDGRFIPTYEGGVVDILAIVKTRGNVIVKKFVVDILPKKPYDILAELCAKYPLEITKIAGEGIQLLTTAECEKNNYPLVTNISYTFAEDVASILRVKGNLIDEGKLVLAENTYIEEAYADVRATIHGEEVVYRQKVKIKLNRDDDIIDKAHAYVMSKLPKVPHTLESFLIPVKYDDIVTIEYSNVPEYIQINKNDTAEATFFIDISKVPRENFANVIDVTYSYAVGESIISETRQIVVRTTGVYHNENDDIEDAVLYHYLRRLVDETYGDNDRLIEADEVKDFTFPNGFSLANSNVQSIKGLEYFEIRGEVDLSQNNIWDLQYLSENEYITHLNLSNNQISNLQPLSFLYNLQELDLSCNLISDIDDLAKLTELQRLYLQDNRTLVDVMGIEKMTKLETFYIFGSGLDTNSMPLSENAIVTSYVNATKANLDVDYRIVEDDWWSPNEKKIIASEAINTIVPVYQFENTITLIYALEYKGQAYSVDWSLSHDKILSFDANGNAVVTPFSGDLKVMLIAHLVQVDDPTIFITKAFDVLSIGTTSDACRIYNYFESDRSNIFTILFSSVYSDAETVIPDTVLRQRIFQMYQRDGEDYATIRYMTLELAEKNNLMEKMRNMGIKDITGLDLLYRLEKVDLANNDIKDISVLKYMPQLKEVNLAYNNLDLSGLDFTSQGAFVKGTQGIDSTSTAFTNLEYFNVFGNPNVYDDDFRQKLLFIYDRMKVKNMYVYSQDEPWDPYGEALNKQLSLGNGNFYQMKAGDSVTLASVLTLEEYAGKTFDIKYEMASDCKQYASMLNNNILTMAAHHAPSRDIYITLNAVMKLRGSSLEHKYPIIIKLLANDSLTIGGVALEAAIPDSTARQYVLQAMYDNNITSGDILQHLSLVTELEFDGSSGFGLKGLELFANLNVQKLTLNFLNDDDKNFALEKVNDLSSSLTELVIKDSFVDLTVLELASLKTLQVYRCSQVVMEKESGGVAENFFENHPSLYAFYAYSNNIFDFGAIQKNQKVRIIHIYDNPASTNAETLQCITAAYTALDFSENRFYDFRILDAYTLWMPDKHIEFEVKDSLGNIVGHDIANLNYYNTEVVLTLPLSITDGGTTTTVEWSTDYSDVTIAGNTATIALLAQTRFVKLTARVLGKNTTFDYYFLVRTGSGNAEDFLENGKLASPYFFVHCMEVLKKSVGETNGIFEDAHFGAIQELVISPLIDNNTHVTSIKGIENFINLTKVDIQNGAISDIKPIYNLSKLQYIDFSHNNISDLWAALSGGGFPYYRNEYGVFENMNNLQTLMLFDNPIKNYTYIVFRYRICKFITWQNWERVERSGAGNLKNLGISLDSKEELCLTFSPQDLSSYPKPDENNPNYKFENLENSYQLFYWLLQNRTQSNALNIYDENGNYIEAHKDSEFYQKATLLNDKLPNEYITYQKGAQLFPVETYLTYEAEIPNPSDFKVQDGIVTLFNADSWAYGKTIRVKVSAQVGDMKICRKVWLTIGDNIPKIQFKLDEIKMFEHLQGTFAFEPLTDGDGIKSGYQLPANAIIPDANLLDALFKIFDIDHNNILSFAEMNNADIEEVVFDGLGILDIRGIDYFTKVKTFKFVGNEIAAIPELRLVNGAKLENLLFVDEWFLKDISKLSYDVPASPADSTIGVGISEVLEEDYHSLFNVLKTLDLIGTSVGQTNVGFIENMPNLMNLDISGSDIYDYSFLNSLQSLQSFGANGICYKLYNNLDTIIKKLFLDTNFTDITRVEGLAKTAILSKFVDFPVVNRQGSTTLADIAFSAFGENFVLSFEASENQLYDMVGNTLTMHTSEEVNKLQGVQVLAVLKLNGTTETYREVVDLSLNSSSLIEFITDCKIELDTRIAALSEIMPDIALRYAFIRAFGIENEESVITIAMMQEKMQNGRLVLSTESGRDWAYDLVQVGITNFAGLDQLNHITKLEIRGFATADFSAIQKMTWLEELYLDSPKINGGKFMEVDDWGWLLSLTNLKIMSVTNMKTTGFEIVADMSSLKQLLGNQIFITNASGFAVAFCQNNGTMSSDNASEIMNTTNDTKKATEILQGLQIDDYLQGSSNYILTTSDTSLFASQIVYQTTVYQVDYQLTTRNGKTIVLASIVFNGAKYQRYFEVAIKK